MFDDLRIVEWEPSECDGEDVTYLRLALESLSQGRREFQIGESGTGLRFLLARLSLEPGQYSIVASKRLLERPHEPLISALEVLGTSVEKIGETRLQLDVRGWPQYDLSLEIDASESSQFASALVLASSRHRFQFHLNLSGELRSQGYLEMTRAMVDGVKAGRKVLVAETDASTVATFACISVAASHHVTRMAIQRLASESLQIEQQDAKIRLETLQGLVMRTRQPDRVIFDFLKEPLTSFDVNLKEAPDLFPCLATLAAFTPGVSKFYGAPHLRLKESDRISGIARLFKTVGISFRELPDGMEVTGVTAEQLDEFDRMRRQGLVFSFDPESDHRLAFAATVLSAGGIPIEVLKRGVVSKSLPMFWTMIEGDAPRVAIIGQRGTGKTEAAKRWAQSLGGRGTLIDLDREIERLAGQSTEEIFETLGETEFRWFEKRAWREIDIETRNSFGAVVVSCGAGFDPAAIDDSWIRVWLRRSTDMGGRIFTDRPRLDKSVDALTESLERNKIRAPRFAAQADRVFEMGEGSIDPSERPWVADLFDLEMGADDSIEKIGGVVTLRPDQNIRETCERLLRWGVTRIEIRDDLWPSTRERGAWEFFSTLPKDRLLVSFRAGDADETTSTLSYLKSWLSKDKGAGFGQIAVDWPYDRKDQTIPAEILSWTEANQIDFVASLHGDAKSTGTSELEKLEAEIPSRAILKAALVISDFQELIRYHVWMEASPRRRVFLPMTVHGLPRWSWYRALTGRRAAMGLAFWREGDGSSLDQPTFSQWWRRSRFQSDHFAAVLGDPVAHSRTPLEHDEFFRKWGRPIFAVSVKRDEVVTALPFLLKLGLTEAAVTAPLKELIEEGRAINTLRIRDGRMETASTDSVGFKNLWESTVGIRKGRELKGPVVVWGGGGVRPAIKDVLGNDAIYLRASIGPTDEMIPPEIVIWAAGENRGAWPETWRPRLLVDLSYTENSMARAIALEAGARYVSGLAMFEAQAAAQRKFWEN